MSGLVGHSMYAILGAKAAAHRGLAVAPIALRHFASFVAGAYLGSDIQVLPAAVCVDTGREVGFGTAIPSHSPITGGAVRPWTLRCDGHDYTTREIYNLFYGRAHLVFGWVPAERPLAIPWDHLQDYFADVLEDVIDLFGPGERQIAYTLGWMVHVVSDSLIKSQQPGVDLQLLDGKYTPRNRPIQDLVTFHEIGEKELHLDWAGLFADLMATPVEPVQRHYMRIGESRGRLAREFPDGWDSSKAALLDAVLKENRRWCNVHAQEVLAEMKLVPGPDGRPECNPELRKVTGLDYGAMVALAEKADFRHALWQIGEAIAAMMEATVRRSARLSRLTGDYGTDWQSWLPRK